MSAQPESEEVFIDTNVGYHYAYNNDDGASRTLICSHESTQVASDSVVREFERLVQIRSEIANQLIAALGNHEIESFSFSDEENMSSNDKDFLNDCLEIIEDSPKKDAVIRIEERIQILNTAYSNLFSEPNPMVHNLGSPQYPASLRGSISVVVSNESDCRILSEATEWSKNGGSGIFTTTDRGDILGYDFDGRDEEASEGKMAEGLPDSFEAFSGGYRSQPERINEQIRATMGYDDDCCLKFFTPAGYLNQA